MPSTWRAFTTALAYRATPTEVVAFGIAGADADARHRAGWLFAADSMALLRALTPPEVRAVVRDKQGFAHLCTNAGVRTPVTLAHCTSGAEIAAALGDLRDGQIVVFKGRSASSGAGMSAVRARDGGFETWPVAGAVLSTTEAARLGGAILGTPDAAVLVQTCVEAHPDLAAAANPAPPVIRAYTGRARGGTAEVLGAMLHRPRRDALLSSGGTVARIDPVTGRAGNALGAVIDPAGVYADPLLDGLIIPNWAETCAQIRAVHDGLAGDAPMLSWDIIAGPDGPVILEANVIVMLYHEQATTRAPAFDGRAAAILASYLHQPI